MVFIVQGKPRSPEGILKVIKETRRDAMQAASELLEHGMAFVTIIAEGRVYTVEEFARTILDFEISFSPRDLRLTKHQRVKCEDRRLSRRSTRVASRGFDAIYSTD